MLMKRVTSIITAVALFAGLGSVQANDYTYTENFTSTTFRDALATTAWWDTLTGTLVPYPFELTILGSYDTPGDARGVAIDGDLAVVADGSAGLRCIDITDLSGVTSLGSYDTPGQAWGVAVAGNHAFVADGSAGLRVVDITNPGAPVELGGYDTPSDARGVAVAGDYAFVADGTGGLVVIDIANPSSPMSVGSYDTPGEALGIFVAGDRAYVADGSAGLRIVDITDPTAPTSLGSYDTPGEAHAVCVAGTHAFVADGIGGLQVVDVTDPTSPTWGGSSAVSSDARGIAVSGNHAYVTDHAAGLHHIDISNPAIPTLLHSIDTVGEAFTVAIDGEYAVVADGSGGVVIVGIAHAEIPSVATRFSGFGAYGRVSGAAISGDYALLAAVSDGLQIVDVSDPLHPVTVGSYDVIVERIVVDGELAFLMYPNGGVIAILDVGNPPLPAFVGSCDTLTYPTDVAVCGDHVYVADGTAGVRVLDIGDPANPAIIGSYDAPQNAYRIAASGDYLFVTDYSALLVLDVSDPTLPVQVGFNDTTVFRDVAIAGDYVYTVDGTYNMDVFDVSNPANPTHAGNYTFEPNYHVYPWWVTVVGDHAYVTSDDYDYGGVYSIDVSDPTTPTLYGGYQVDPYLYEQVWDVVIDGDRGYVSDIYNGLTILEIFDREYKANTNTAVSRDVDARGGIVSARIATVQTDSITWELSADGGASWEEFIRGGGWQEFTNKGDDLLWRATLYTGGCTHPACTGLAIDYRDEAFDIMSIADIPNDQGRRVRISWSRSGYDYVGISTPIQEYAVYRKIDRGLSTASNVEVTAGKGPVLAYLGDEWDFVTVVPATAGAHYSVVVPTLADSTISKGAYNTTFFVRALTATLGLHVDSPPDSGHSVDNLPPATPTNLVVTTYTGSGNTLVWDPCPDTDFQYFRIYRANQLDNQPAQFALVATTIETEWVDTDCDDYRGIYRVTAVDFSGNESGAGNPVKIVDIPEPTLPTAFAMYQNAPNPFNPVTTIRYDVPAGGGEVSILIYDVVGRLVRTLVSGPQVPGRKTVTWQGRDNRGQRVSSGVYFCRMRAAGYERTMKMTITE
jgi:hypothetical protein